MNRLPQTDCALRSSLKARVRRRRKYFTEVSFSDIGRGMKGMLRWVLILCIGLSVAGIWHLVTFKPEYTALFGMIMAACCGVIAYWRHAGGRGLPLLPILVVQQGLVFAMPLGVRNPSIEYYSRGAHLWSAISVALALTMLCVGWNYGLKLVEPKPSRYILSLGVQANSGRRCLELSLCLVGIGLAYQIIEMSGLMEQIVPIPLQSIVRTFSSAPVAIGAVLGGFALCFPGNLGLRMAFWTLIVVQALVAIRDLALSGVMGPIFGLIIGMAFGRKRVPWIFLGISIIALAVLNKGKFAMRDKYWSLSGGNYVRVNVSELPTFYVEWLMSSVQIISENQQVRSSRYAAREDEKGQSLSMRVDNLQNILFFVEAMESKRVEPLMGKAYALIPPLLIPRFMWPDKPRTHEGQILLNLHFGRQASVEDTERTYFSVGLLPEAVGNFGAIGGGIAFGLVGGLICGLVESWSSRKKLFSIEGLFALGLLLQMTVSIEMSASVFVTSTFQLFVVIGIGGMGLYYLLEFIGQNDQDSGRNCKRFRRRNGPQAPQISAIENQRVSSVPSDL